MKGPWFVVVNSPPLLEEEKNISKFNTFVEKENFYQDCIPDTQMRSHYSASSERSDSSPLFSEIKEEIQNY